MEKSPTLQIVECTSPGQIETARTLFLEYAAFLDFDLSFQNFEDELRDLPGVYAPPSGSLLLAYLDEEVVGCAALRHLAGTTCEMKRLFVRPGARGSGAGRALAQRIISEARVRGYTAIRLDTIEFMTEAIKLYRSLGFQEIEAYRFNPIPGVAYYELVL